MESVIMSIDWKTFIGSDVEFTVHTVCSRGTKPEKLSLLPLSVKTQQSINEFLFSFFMSFKIA